MGDNKQQAVQTSNRKGGRLWIFAILFLVLLLVVALNLTLGSVRIPLKDILGTILGSPGIKDSWVYIVRSYRLPKIVTAILAGIALSASGLQMQTMFRNPPWQTPFILGINSGASLGGDRDHGFDHGWRYVLPAVSSFGELGGRSGGFHRLWNCYDFDPFGWQDGQEPDYSAHFRSDVWNGYGALW